MNIYVGNLSWQASNEDLQELFAPYGEVLSAKVVMDKFNPQRSKGFGFVEMQTEAAQQAIQALHNQEILGRKLIVNESKPRPDGFSKPAPNKPKFDRDYSNKRTK